MIRCRIVFLFLLCFLPMALHAQGSSTGFGFLGLPYSARNAALGEASVADTSDRLSAFLNPAALSGTSAFGISLSHQQWIQGVTSNLLHADLALPFGRLGIRVASTTVPGIEIRTVPGPPEGIFNARSALIGLTAAFPLQTNLTAGITLQHIYEKLYVDEATGTLYDMGLLYVTPLEGISAGVSLQHAGFVGRLRDRRSRLPVTLRGGLSYRFETGDYVVRTLFAISTEANQSGARMHGGIEGVYADLAAIRIGYQTGHETRGFAAGFGVHSSNLMLDYGFVPFSHGLGSGHLITIGYRI